MTAERGKNVLFLCVQNMEKTNERKITCIFGSCSRSQSQCCQNPRYGAIPVPGPIHIIGLVESVGKWKLDALFCKNDDENFGTLNNHFQHIIIMNHAFFLSSHIFK